MTLRVCSSVKRLAAALGVVLLPFGVLAGSANAQTTDDAEVLRTITNTAEASWLFEGRERETVSNEVRFDVTLPPPEIRAFRPTPQGGVDLNFRAPLCAASGQGPAGSGGGGSSPIELTPVEGAAEVTSIIRPGQTMLFEITALQANVDPNEVDRMDVTITTSTGDEESLTIFETGNNTGTFVGQIGTARIPPTPASGDCQLSINDGASISIEAFLPGETTVVVETEVQVLADPFGVVFDSETGQPVSGARVSLVDAATGAPATVFAEDGVTPWPSTVISGEPVTYGDGLVFNPEAGEFWFPLTFLGTYRLVIEPPEPYTAPSAASRSSLAQLSRPDGRSFIILDASFGDVFELNDPTPIQVDIPLDRPAEDIGLVKTASRDRVQPGDVVFYSITARNDDPSRPRRDVVLTDTPSSSLRFRADSVRVNGAEAPDQIAFAPDGSSLTVSLGDLAPGENARVTYAMSVLPDAAPGIAPNDVVSVDSIGRTARTSVAVEVERETIADRMTIIGRITAGPCSVDNTKENPRPGVPGVRVVMEDGSYAITDADGRYHFEGVVPGTHVVAVARMTVPEGGELVNCYRDTRNAGSASSRFVIGQGGSLVVADFDINFPEGTPAFVEQTLEELNGEARPDGDAARAVNAIAGGSGRPSIERATPAVSADTLTGAGIPASTAEAAERAEPVYAANTDWLALGDGEDGFLYPGTTANPRSPAIRVAIRHRRGQQIKLRVNGEEVSGLSFDGTLTPAQGRFAVSTWRGIVLDGDRTVLEADVINSFGGVSKTFSQEVFFTSTPARVELVPEQSNLVADGRTRPVVAIRVLDRNDRPLREGVSGNFTLNAPYESGEQIDRQQLNQLTGFNSSQARWVVEGTDGIAKIELAPTMVSGSLRLDFQFNDGELVREQQLETWVVPGDIEWTIVGLAEGTVGAKSVAENMEREGRFDSDLGDNARVALYAKGRILGKFLTTIAYDSAKQREDQRVLGQLDPNAYYTVFADASSRRFDAASREKLYVRIETATFYALYGDFETAFDQTRLARYNRTATGVKGEARVGQFKASAFAAEISTRLQREEIQGQGITGPYQLGSRNVVPNSERVTIEVRDRFRSELIVSSRTLTRFLDYDLDLLTGTITFTRPVLSRDENLNPQFIVVEYETDGLGNAEMNAGARVDWTSKDGRVRIGANAITDKGEGARTDIGSLDVRADISSSTQVRGEIAMSRSEGETATGWLAEVQHQTGKLDILAYAHQLDQDYGVGQQNGVDQGRRKVGVDGRVFLSDHLSVLGSVWQDDSLQDSSRRRAAQAQLNLTRKNTDFRVGLAHFNDRLTDGTTNTSTVLEGGVTQRLFDNALELSASTAIALDKAESIDLPARHRIGARYAVAQGVRLVGSYEIADGENIDARTLRGGVEVTPWQGGQIITSIGQDNISELGNRTFAAFGLAQTLQLSPEFSIDATIDGNRTLNGAPDVADLVNPLQPAASGGQLTGGQQFEDFTAVTLGGAWRKDRWSITGRGEYRDGELADRMGATFGAIRQLGEGSIVGSGFTWTKAEDENGPMVEIMDAAIAFAHRPDFSEFAMLGKLEYRSDKVTGGIAGVAGGAGSSALLVDGDALSRRLIASWSTNWTPRDFDEDDDGIITQTRRNEFGLFVGGRYNFDKFEGTEFSGTTAFLGADARIGVGEIFEIGASATVRAMLEGDLASFSYGPTIGVTPVEGMLITVGYNIEGFRDGDFSAARNTDKGVFASVRMKFDTSSFDFLGLDR